MHEKPHIQNDTFTSEWVMGVVSVGWACFSVAGCPGSLIRTASPFLKLFVSPPIRTITSSSSSTCSSSVPHPTHNTPRSLPLLNSTALSTPTRPPHTHTHNPAVNYRLAKDHLLKLSISHALAQSTKLTVYEERVVEIVESTRELPVILATTGSVRLGRREIAQLIGRVFLQKSAVNLLSTVLDTPEFFWSAPDAMQSLYKRVCDYVEYDARVEVLNARFQVLQEMLDMLRDHQNNGHGARLEWIVIWLIVVEVVVGLFECASILGWVG